MSTRRLVVSAAAMAAVVCAAPAAAQPQAADVRTRVEALEQEVTELRAAAAQTATLSQAITELAAKTAGMREELELLRRERASMPAAVATIDDLSATVRALERELEGLRTQMADFEQPAAVSAGAGGVRHDGGFSWVTVDNRHSLTLFGYLHTRFQARLSEDFDDFTEATFRIRRARFGAIGHVLSEDLTFKLAMDLSEDGTQPLRDYLLEYRFADELSLRAGQGKVPFSRVFLTSSRKLAFLERDLATESLRYDRDIGVWALGRLWDGRARYYAGLSNGSGVNAENDNIDFVSMARGELALLGDYIGYSQADLAGSSDLGVTVGAAAAHELSRVPAAVAGIEVGQRDVDSNGVLDNVRVWTAGADLVARWRRFELSGEVIWRQERWGTILDHSENAALAGAVRAGADGVKNYLGATGQLTHAFFLQDLVAGVRVSRARLPLLGISGDNPSSPPVAGRAWEFSGTAQLYRAGYRFLGIDYTFTNYDAVVGADPDRDKDHRFIIESQLVW